MWELGGGHVWVMWQVRLEGCCLFWACPDLRRAGLCGPRDSFCDDHSGIDQYSFHAGATGPVVYSRFWLASKELQGCGWFFLRQLTQHATPARPRDDERVCSDSVALSTVALWYNARAEPVQAIQGSGERREDD